MSGNKTTTPSIEEEKAEAKRMMLSGLALGLVDIAAIAALGVGCPLCTVAAPALIGWGAYKAWKAKHQEKHPPPQGQLKIIDCVFEAEEKHRSVGEPHPAQGNDVRELTQMPQLASLRAP